MKNKKERFPVTDVQPGEHDDDLHVENIEHKKELEIKNQIGIEVKKIVENEGVLITEFDFNNKINSDHDSLELASIVFDLESHFQVQIKDKEVEELITYKDIVDLIYKKKNS